MMTTPLSVYQASQRFINASIALDPSVKSAKTESETRRVCQFIGRMQDCDHHEYTLALEALSVDDGPFDNAQRLRIAQVIQGMVGDDRDVAAASNKSTVKEQSCKFIFNYYTETIWGVLESQDTPKNKFTQTSNLLVDVMGLRNPDQQTKRLIVSCQHIASGEQADPTKAYQDVQLLNDILRNKRATSRGNQTLRVFPENPQEFIDRYPGAYPDGSGPVECDKKRKDAILAHATKDAVPLKSTNKMLSNTSTTLATMSPQMTAMGMGPMASPQMSAMGMAPMAMMANPMFQMMARSFMSNFIHGNDNGNASAGNSSNPDWLTILTDGNRSSGSGQSRDSGMIQDNDSHQEPVIQRGQRAGLSQGEPLPGCLQNAKTKSQGLAELQSDVQDRLRRAASLQASSDAQQDADLDDDIEKATKPSTNTATKPSTKPQTRPMKKHKKHKKQNKQEKQKKQNQTTTLLKRPAAAVKEVAGVPKCPKDVPTGAANPPPTEYNGGIIYVSQIAQKFKSLTTKGDKYSEKQVAWGKTRSKADAWKLALKAIDDKRNSE